MKLKLGLAISTYRTLPEKVSKNSVQQNGYLKTIAKSCTENKTTLSLYKILYEIL